MPEVGDGRNSAKLVQIRYLSDKWFPCQTLHEHPDLNAGASNAWQRVISFTAESNDIQSTYYDLIRLIELMQEVRAHILQQAGRHRESILIVLSDSIIKVSSWY